MAVSGGAGAPQWRPEDDADYGRRLLGHVFARYVWLIILAGLAGGVVFLIISLYQPRVYVADGSVQVNPSASAGGAAAAGLAPLLGTGPDLTAEVEKMNSHKIIDPVIADLNLQAEVVDLQPSDSSLRSIKQRFGMAPPLHDRREDLFTRLQLRDVLVDPELLKSVTYELDGTPDGGWRVNGRSGSAGQRAVLDHISFTPVFGPAHKPGYKYLIVVHPAQDAFETFQKSLGTQIVSSIIKVDFRYFNPVIAARAVNDLMQHYLDDYGASKGTDYNVVLTFVKDEMDKRTKRIAEITKRLDKYQAESGSYLPTAQGGAAIQALSQLEQAQVQNEIQLANLNNVLGNWTHRSPEDIYNTIQAPATNLPIEQSLVTGLADLIGRLQAARLTKTERHPDVVALKASIQQQIGLIRDALASNRNVLTTTNAQITREIAQQQHTLHNLPEAESRIFILTSELQVNTDILGKLKQQEMNTQLQQASVEREARVLDSSSAPIKKDAPRVGRNTVIGGVAGGTLMALLALLLEALNRRTKSLREVRLGTGVPVLAALPGPRLRGRWVARERNPLLFKRLAAFLDAPGKVIGIVQLPAADSTFEVAWGLAQAVSTSGRPALLIDADRMDSALCAALQQEPRFSLTDAAAGEVEVNRTLMQLDEQRWLAQLGTGRLDSATMARVLSALQETFDTLIVCLPPPLQWNGQEQLGEMLDTVLLSVPQGSMLLEELRENVTELRVLGIEPDGAVVTNYDSRRDVLGKEELRFVAVRPSR